MLVHPNMRCCNFAERQTELRSAAQGDMTAPCFYTTMMLINKDAYRDSSYTKSHDISGTGHRDADTRMSQSVAQLLLQ